MSAGSARRECGDCSLCCKVMAIEELTKPAGSWCAHCAPGRGCRNYPNRPRECRDFSCLWLIDSRFGTHWKPNSAKLVLTTSADGLEIRCDPGFPGAWRKEPFRSEIRNLARSGESRDVSVLVIVGEKMTLITSDHEFELGVVGEDERIVREFEGTRIANATVVKAHDLEK
jgi:hypothetical protein